MVGCMGHGAMKRKAVVSVGNKKQLLDKFCFLNFPAAEVVTEVAHPESAKYTLYRWPENGAYGTVGWSGTTRQNERERGCTRGRAGGTSNCIRGLDHKF